jgi:hypothetical protein
MTVLGIGLVLAVLVVGGLGLDLWRVVIERRALSEWVDAAAAAGANGLDTATFRSTGALVLDPALAHDHATANLGSRPRPAAATGAPTVVVEPTRITVAARGHVDFTVLSLLSPGDGVDLFVSAEARPRSSGGG